MGGKASEKEWGNVCERGEKADSYRWNSRRLASLPHTGSGLERRIDRGHTPWCSGLLMKNKLYSRPSFVGNSQLKTFWMQWMTYSKVKRLHSIEYRSDCIGRLFPTFSLVLCTPAAPQDELKYPFINSTCHVPKVSIRSNLVLLNTYNYIKVYIVTIIYSFSKLVS